MQGNIQVQGSSSVVFGANFENQDASNAAKHKPDISSFALQSNDLFAALPMNVNNVEFKSTNVVTDDFMWDGFRGAEDISKESGIIATSTNSTEHKSGSSSSLPESRDLFIDSLGDNRISNVERKSTVVTTNGFMWDSFIGVEKLGNGSEIDDKSSNSFPPSDDLFAALLEAVEKSSEMVDGLKPPTIAIDSSRLDVFGRVEKIDNGNEITAASRNLVEHKPGSNEFPFPLETTSMKTNGFTFDTFPEIEVVDNGNGPSIAVATATAHEDDDFDDFGDFMDASQEVRTHESEHIVPHTTVVQTASENEKSQDKPTLLINTKEALPLSLFGQNTEENNETVNHSDEFVHKPTSDTGNGISGAGSVVSIHDLISNLYGQAQNTVSIGSDGKPAENGAHNSQEEESPSLDGDDERDNDWEFKDAFQETGVGEKPSNCISGNVAHIQFEASGNANNYIAFYTALREALCVLLSCQLDELQKTRCSDTKSLDIEIQEVHKLLEQSLVSQVVSEKYPEKSSCLNEVLKTLEGPEFQIIESEYSLSTRLQLAVNDWRDTADLLKHAILVLKTLYVASYDEQCRYVSTWSNIINACAQELRYGALIWKRVSEKKVQHQVLSDCRGLKHIQALGEIYKVVELLGLSAEVYKAWMLFSVSDPSQFTGVLNECRALWQNSGLEEALQNLSDDIAFGCDETIKTILGSVKSIRNLDVLAMHDCVFGQRKSVCRLSLLPQEMLQGLKTVLWNGQPYFISLANLWANLISPEPPQLPVLKLSEPDC
ncbi:hypothetical protein RND81_04G204200 [Saponaria officinalis]|uniref:Synergin gamma C-terminal domain-containing protein n=2 Tax=Saponaria officinalis TaxID=3572 RepID=A0AAW1LGD6_SAPOF